MKGVIPKTRVCSSEARDLAETLHVSRFGDWSKVSAVKRKDLSSEGGKSGVIYFKSILAGLLAVLAAAILTVIVVVLCLSIASRSSETGAVGWDPISLARPLTWLAVVLVIFLVGFFWEFFQVNSKKPT